MIIIYNMSNPRYDVGIIDQNPFEGMHIDDDSVLDDLEGRYPCPKCNKSRKYFCYTCYVPVSKLEGLLPAVKLPLKIDIIKHKNETDGKSTAAHAAVLAPEDITIFTYPDIPDYSNVNAVLIYPSFDAIDVDQLFYNVSQYNNMDRSILELPKGHNKTTLMTRKSNFTTNLNNSKEKKDLRLDRAVFIDSTWNQSKGIYKDERIRNLRCVVLQNRLSQFWRYQKGSPRWYLSTIEAIHQFLIEIHLKMWGLKSEYSGLKSFNKECIYIEENIKSEEITSYNGQYDNLLFFFKHMYKVIHLYYDHEMLFAYQRPLL